MAAKQLNADDANLSPTVVQERYSTPYSPSHPETQEVVKCRIISVPDAYCHALLEHILMLLAEGPDHYVLNPSHLSICAPELGECRWPHNPHASHQYSDTRVPKLARVPGVAGPNGLATQCCISALELMRSHHQDMAVKMPVNLPTTAKQLGSLPPAQGWAYLRYDPEEEEVIVLPGLTLINDQREGHIELHQLGFAGYLHIEVGSTMPYGQYGYPNHAIPPPW